MRKPEESPLSVLFERYKLPWLVDDSREPNEGFITVYAADGEYVMGIEDMELAEYSDMLLGNLMGVAGSLYMECLTMLEAWDRLSAIMLVGAADPAYMPLMQEIQASRQTIRELLRQAAGGVTYEASIEQGAPEPIVSITIRGRPEAQP